MRKLRRRSCTICVKRWVLSDVMSLIENMVFVPRGSWESHSITNPDLVVLSFLCRSGTPRAKTSSSCRKHSTSIVSILHLNRLPPAGLGHQEPKHQAHGRSTAHPLCQYLSQSFTTCRSGTPRTRTSSSWRRRSTSTVSPPQPRLLPMQHRHRYVIHMHARANLLEKKR